MRCRTPSTPYLIFLVLALLCGLGGGNFASSMSNISFFFPKTEKGNALALNAGLGNLGVSVMQFLVPLVITVGVFGALGGEPQAVDDDDQALDAERRLHLGAVPDRLGHRRLVRHERHRRRQGLVRGPGGDLQPHPQLDHVLALHRHLRLLHRLLGRASRCWPRSPSPTSNSLQYVFLGPLVGALSRAGTGWVSDRCGGGRVTFWIFARDDRRGRRRALLPRHQGAAGSFWGFFAMFMVLFLATGVGNASTFQMIPVIMRKEIDRLMPKLTAAERTRQADKESAAIIGFTSAIAAYGAFFIPKAYGTSIADDRRPGCAPCGGS